MNRIFKHSYIPGLVCRPLGLISKIWLNFKHTDAHTHTHIVIYAYTYTQNTHIIYLAQFVNRQALKLRDALWYVCLYVCMYVCVCRLYIEAFWCAVAYMCACVCVCMHTMYCSFVKHYVWYVCMQYVMYVCMYADYEAL